MYYNKWITTPGNGIVQLLDSWGGKLKSTVIADSGVHTRTDDKIIKSPFNMNDVATINNKQISNKDLITRACRIDTMMSM